MRCAFRLESAGRAARAGIATQQNGSSSGHLREAAPQRRRYEHKAWDSLGATRKEQGFRGITFKCMIEDGLAHMNNNSSRQPNNNNRRRGRNNNNNSRQQQNNRSGFDFNNSIDNRARGNASQMLEKYKKLAQDAQFNDDRVNAEYHLQFADHYFRVLADFRSRQEARQDQQGERRPRDDSREDSADRDDWQNEDRAPSYDEQGSNEGADVEQPRDADSEGRRPQREDRPRRNDRYERGDRNNNDRGNNGDRSANRAPRRHHSEDVSDEPAGLDIAVLPPSIAVANDFDDSEAEIKPARKPRARKPKSANDEDVVTAAE